mmetsp:Transcript_129343/g.258246  ORF Transcript_129343/g.258246 Transcript_129343/m.258246 type:complete len:152 (-) Transcript_129343:10-465(-)
MESMAIDTPLGQIVLKMKPEAAPETCKYVTELVKAGLYDGTSFYRSDFVIQMGTYGTSKKAPVDLHVNETNAHMKISNTRGTAAIAHWDVPDCGNSEFFINLGTNAHLDTAYGGYCVFAVVEDDASFVVVDRIAEAIKTQKSVAVSAVHME